MNEQQLVKQAEVTLKSIRFTDDPLRREALCTEYNHLVDKLDALHLLADKLDLLHIQPNKMFFLLPIELTCKIFETVVASNPNGPFLLANVCKQWYTVVYQNPSMWTNVVIDTSRPRCLSNLKIFSIQSKDRLLDVTIHARIKPDVVDVTSKLMDFHRWKTLVIQASDYTQILNDPVVASLFHADPFPNLITIDVQAPGLTSTQVPLWSSLFPDDGIPDTLSKSARAALQSHLTIGMFFTGTKSIVSLHPNLKYLTLLSQNGFGSAQSNDQSTIPLHQLRGLRIDYENSDILMAIECPKIENLSVSITDQRIPELHDKLRGCVHLQQLTIQIFLLDDPLPISFPSFSSQMSQFSHLPCLKTLEVSGGICDAVLSVILAPEICSLILTGGTSLSADTLLSFLGRSPMLYYMQLDRIQEATEASTIEPEARAISTQTSSSLSCSLEKIQTNHAAAPVLRHLSLPNLRHLHLRGILLNIRTNQGEIHLSNLIPPALHVLGNLTTLDFCSDRRPFYILVGLPEILPYLNALEFLALPRPMRKKNIMIDILIQMMHKGDQDGVPVCPRLKTLKTECYPEWEGLLEVLGERNRVAHIPEDKRKILVPLECIILPALPHPSILERVQLALAGKFPLKSDLKVESNGEMTGCDDCLLTGWLCDKKDVTTYTEFLLTCYRHTKGPVRITGYRSHTRVSS
ncbi:hypothetical protein M408DRAFT_300499 [Serendipita vermifera MAFF 305830]|uniref:Uncharacterized protein n=1 Tax=Serendipita vermifera MAFF 305830 TaxID=933852 RepID=A0A0C3AAX7_SERVB|nr:hypothetical protein M408DRAFT_300499 [Serendipita vermifera MAFF 305830]